jgi:hypothetical protein
MKCKACDFDKEVLEARNTENRRQLNGLSGQDRENAKRSDALLSEVDDPVPDWIVAGYLLKEDPAMLFTVEKAQGRASAARRILACPKCGTLRIEIP